MVERYSQLIGTGSALPKRVVTNDEMATKVDTSDEWIVSRSGIHQRHFISEDESTLSLAVEAGSVALEQSGIAPSAIDGVLVATATPTHAMPSMASFVQRDLGIGEALAMDINAACSGFMYVMATADAWIKQGLCKCVLVIGADSMSQLMDWDDRSTCVLFGDGAGACVLRASDKPGIVTTFLGGDATRLDALCTTPHHSDAHVRHQLAMQGREVFRNAVHILERLVPQTLEKAGLEASSIDWLVPHQANIRIIKATAKLLGMSMDKVIVTLDKHGNTSAASIPLALDAGMRQGKIKPGQWVLMEAFGAGFSWGSVLMQCT